MPLSPKIKTAVGLTIVLVLSVMASITVLAIDPPSAVMRSAWADSAWSTLKVRDLLRTQWSWAGDYSSAIQDLEVKKKLDLVVRQVLNAPFAYAPANRFSHIVIHHTACSSPPNGSAASVRKAYWENRVRSIWVEHTFLRDYSDNGTRYGWGDIGYHYLVTPEGRIYQGRASGFSVSGNTTRVNQGAHAPGGNVGSLAIALLGDFTTSTPTEAALSAAAHLAAWHLKMSGINSASETAPLEGKTLQRVIGHRDVVFKECPGNAFYPQLSAFRQRVQALLDQGGSTPPPPPPNTRTGTVLIMDVSGSMGQRWQGGVKLESAKEAALQFINHVEQENLTQGTEHWIGVVGFSSGAHLLLPLTNNYSQARRTIISMSATSATNLGAGLTVGLQEVSSLRGQVQRYVTVLSDGNTNTGLSQSQILSGPVAQARSAKICINTVAFGNKGDVDEDFLRQVASRSGCGRYEYAASGFDLFAAYIKIRHHALGQVISGLSSFGERVTPIAGRSFSLGTISIPSGQRELQITLGWSESGRLQLRLYDPAGRQVTTSYPGAQIYTSGQFAHAIVTSPIRGIWRVDALPSTSMAGGTEYFAIGSTRPGGIAFALPLPVFTVGDRTFALPGNMPTWALVLVSVVFIAIGVWQLLSDAGLL